MTSIAEIEAAAAASIHHVFGETGTLERSGGSAERVGVVSLSVDDGEFLPGRSLDRMDTLTLLTADGDASVGDVWIDSAGVRWGLTVLMPTSESQNVMLFRVRRET